MNQRQVRICEEALYSIKYLPGQIEALRIEVDSMLPQTPGSILKMTGRVVAKSPFDTSETEDWGIKRVISREGQELAAKQELNTVLRQWASELTEEDSRFVRLVYGKEWPRHTVIRELGITPRQYYRIRERILQQVWWRIKHLMHIMDMAVV